METEFGAWQINYPCIFVFPDFARQIIQGGSSLIERDKATILVQKIEGLFTLIHLLLTDKCETL